MDFIAVHISETDKLHNRLSNGNAIMTEKLN